MLRSVRVDLPVQEMEPEAPAPPGHPAWLQALSHYDPNYAYDLVHHEYDEWHTTDPYYLTEEVRLPPSTDHSLFLSEVEGLLKALAQSGGVDWPWTREALIHEIPANATVPGLDRSRERIAPDIALWPAGTPVKERSSLSFREDGAPLLVLECLSPSTRAKDLADNPAIYRWMGVQEYWLYDPGPSALSGYCREADGPWTPVPAGREGGLYSRILATDVRCDGETGLQCWSSEAELWLSPWDGYRREGFTQGDAEGFTRGHAEGRAEGEMAGLLVYAAYRYGQEMRSALEDFLQATPNFAPLTPARLKALVQARQDGWDLAAWWRQQPSPRLDHEA